MKDWRGTTILVGDTVVYPTRVSSSMWMMEGTVVDICEEEKTIFRWSWETKQKEPYTYTLKSIKVKGKEHGKIVRPDTDRITVIPGE